MSSRQRKGLFNARNSDGCTIISKPYNLITGKHLTQRPCCIKHDEWYYYGGTAAQKLEADTQLRDCVISYGDTPFERKCFVLIGWLMFFAVRFGGSPKLPFPWRWRNNVPFQMEDVKSGYKTTPVDYRLEQKMDAVALLVLALQRLPKT